MIHVEFDGCFVDDEQITVRDAKASFKGDLALLGFETSFIMSRILLRVPKEERPGLLTQMCCSALEMSRDERLNSKITTIDMSGLYGGAGDADDAD